MLKVITHNTIFKLTFMTLLCSHLIALPEARSAEKTPDLAVQNTSPQAAPWQRDPFIRTSKKPNAALPAKIGVRLGNREVNLQGIMKVNDKFFAIINGRVVGVGNKLNGVTVKSISKTAVVFEDDAGKRKIDIYKGLVR